MPTHSIATDGAFATQDPSIIDSLPKIYVAKIKQSGTDNPTVTVFKNTIGNIVWTRFSQGIYHGTLEGAFPVGKTICPPFYTPYALIGIFSNTPFDFSYNLNAKNGADGNHVEMRVFNNTGASVDLSEFDQTEEILIEINVYP